LREAASDASASCCLDLEAASRPPRGCLKVACEHAHTHTRTHAHTHTDATSRLYQGCLEAASRQPAHTHTHTRQPRGSLEAAWRRSRLEAASRQPRGKAASRLPRGGLRMALSRGSLEVASRRSRGNLDAASRLPRGGRATAPAPSHESETRAPAPTPAPESKARAWAPEPEARTVAPAQDSVPVETGNTVEHQRVCGCVNALQNTTVATIHTGFTEFSKANGNNEAEDIAFLTRSTNACLQATNFMHCIIHIRHTSWR